VRAVLASLRAGLRSLGRNTGLVAVVFASNLGLALVLAVPLAFQLEQDLRNRGASSTMMYGFDFDWWSQWSERQTGAGAALAPDLLGSGFALRNLELLLQGYVPAGLFARAERLPLDASILGLGLLYLLAQAFLAGGILSAFRRPRGGFALRGFLHASGFYFGRMARLSLVALAGAGLVFALNVPLARLVDGLAREAVSGRTALALVLSRHAALLVTLLLVHMVVSHARVLVVREERLSVLLAALSSLVFCVRRFAAAFGQYLCVGLAALALVWIFGRLDASLSVVGYRSQLAALALMQGFVAARIALRLWLAASQLELQRAGAGTAEGR